MRTRPGFARLFLVPAALLTLTASACRNPDSSSSGSAVETESEPTSTGMSETSAPAMSSSGGGASTTTPVTTGADTTAAIEPQPRVRVVTTVGEFVIELEDQLAPMTVENFLRYVNTGFYDGSDGLGATIIHRAEPEYVIQGGGYTEEQILKATRPPIINEAVDTPANLRGSVAMARADDPDSATSQFFINLVDNPQFDRPPGYAVFGHVVEGMDVVDMISEVETNEQDVPLQPITIVAATTSS